MPVTARETIRAAVPEAAIVALRHQQARLAMRAAQHAFAAAPTGPAYSQLLFERAVLEQYVDDHGFDPIPFESLNGWSVGRFRRLWAADIETVGYREIPQIAGRELITEYPSCFRAKTDDFDDLRVALIRATFRVGARRTGSRPGSAGPAVSRRPT